MTTGPAADLPERRSACALFSYNAPAIPAKRGSIVVLYATGDGQSDPAGIDGRIVHSIFPKPLLPVSVTIDGMDAEVLYAGAAPELIAGVLQVNVKIPEGAASGERVSIHLTVGATKNEQKTTISIE